MEQKNGEDAVKKKFLFPADLFVSREPHEVTTLLGTCVAVAIYEPKLKIGGINHYLLPASNGKTDELLKYGDTSTYLLLKKMQALGCNPANLVAKIFGGTDTMDYFKTGQNNVETAKTVLKKHGIKIIADNTGGDFGRKILYFTSNGAVYLKFLDSNVSRKKTDTMKKWSGVCPNKPFCDKCRSQTMVDCVLSKTFKY